MSGLIKIEDYEVTVSENKSSDIALSSFGGYLGFVGEMSEQFGGTAGKRPPLHKGTKCDMRFKSSLNSARLNLLNPYK